MLMAFENCVLRYQESEMNQSAHGMHDINEMDVAWDEAVL